MRNALITWSTLRNHTTSYQQPGLGSLLTLYTFFYTSLALGNPLYLALSPNKRKFPSGGELPIRPGPGPAHTRLAKKNYHWDDGKGGVVAVVGGEAFLRTFL
jgi:hypothetical protein